jgi:hypothetical protein
MDLTVKSKMSHSLSRAPVWLRFPALAILFYSSSLISAAIVHRIRHGGWEMDWAILLEDTLYGSVLMALIWTWLTRKSANKGEQAERQRS